ncbi:MAG TPA: hypothetical protein VIY51_05510 [Xanthobacteraceae bacterium]
MTNARLTKVSSFSLAGAAALLVWTIGFAAAQGTAQQQQACTPDAMRLCSEFIPDVAKISACMSRKRAQVSAACRAAIKGPSHGKASHRHHHHR